MRVEIKHFAGSEIFTGLGAEGGEIGIRPAAGKQQRDPPCQAARHEHHTRTDHRAGHAAADPIHQHEQQQRQGVPHRLRSQPDAERREKRADHDHAA